MLALSPPEEEDEAPSGRGTGEAIAGSLELEPDPELALELRSRSLRGRDSVALARGAEAGEGELCARIGAVSRLAGTAAVLSLLRVSCEVVSAESVFGVWVLGAETLGVVLLRRRGLFTGCGASSSSGKAEARASAEES